MAWTFDPALVQERDRLRLLVGDTDTTDQLLTDESADFILSTIAADAPARLEQAAAMACRTLAARFARRVDFDQGGMSVSASQRAARYTALAQEFQSRVDAAGRVVAGGYGYQAGRAGSLGRPVVGGVPVVDLSVARGNRVQPLDSTDAPPAVDPVTGAPLGGG